MAEIAIGIDLGTSNSCVARAANGTVEVLANAYGEKTTASVVAFRADGSISVGNAARANIIHEPEHTIYSAKRLIGRYFFSEEVKKARAIYSYPIIEGENHALRIQARGEDFSLPEISAMVLRELKGIAEARLGQPVTKAVVTVPAYFNDNQRQATVDAGRIAGLDVLRIINEPTAAALAYGFGKGLKQRVAIYDLGGGTFDISVLEIGEDIFEVLAVSGDTFLGGDDFDDRIIDLLADEFVAAHGINLRNDRYALEKLKAAAETAKCGLSVDDEVEIRIPEIIDGDEGTLSLERTLTRTEFGGLVGDLVQRTFKVCDEALQQAGIVARDLDGVVLVGGPTRLPLIRDAVRSYFQQDPKTDVDPDLVVGMGAAIQASSLISPSSDAFLLDVTPLSLRIGVAGGLAETVIERNTPVPIEQTRTFTTFKDHQESVSIRVYQGESREVEENERLGEFEFSGFEKARRGEVEIDVTFEIDTDGIVSVTARDRRTGEEASTRITLSSGLSESEIQSIIERGNTDRVVTEAGPDETTTAPRDEVQEALSALPLTDSSPEFAARLEPAPDAAPAPSALEPEPGLGSGAVPDIAAEGPLAVAAAAAPRPEPASAPDPSQTVLYSEPDDLDLDDDLNLDLEDNALALAPPEGIGDRGTDPMLADSAAGPMSTDPAAQTVVAEPIASALDAPPGSGSANSNAITVPDLDGDTGAADRDEGPTEEHEIFRAEIDIRDAAASIDLEPAVSNEIDLEIEIEVDGTVEGAAVHELTDDLSIDTTSNLTELTTGKAPAIADPAESAKDELFERTGIDLTADDDSKNEG